MFACTTLTTSAATDASMIGPFALPVIALAFAGFLLIFVGYVAGGNEVAGLLGVVALGLAVGIQLAISRQRRPRP
jgi:hypothetical protein